VTFDGNGAIVAAVAAGELPAGLVNHYYLFEAQEEAGGSLPIANHFFAAGDVGSLVNVAGVGVLGTAANADNALVFADYLLQTEAQTYFAEQTAEYPLIAAVETAEGLTPLADLESPDIDLSNLADLQGTLALLTEVGIV
jgi:iron(III) transport system substrate-binding protein